MIRFFLILIKFSKRIQFYFQNFIKWFKTVSLCLLFPLLISPFSLLLSLSFYSTFLSLSLLLVLSVYLFFVLIFMPKHILVSKKMREIITNLKKYFNIFREKMRHQKMLGVRGNVCLFWIFSQFVCHFFIAGSNP